jgi:hypothetical protein
MNREAWSQKPGGIITKLLSPCYYIAAFREKTEGGWIIGCTATAKN